MLTQEDFYNSILSMASSLSEITETTKRLEDELKEIKEFQKYMNAPEPATVEETVVEPTGEVKKTTRKKKVTLNEGVSSNGATD